MNCSWQVESTDVLRVAAYFGRNLDFEFIVCYGRRCRVTSANFNLRSVLTVPVRPWHNYMVSEQARNQAKVQLKPLSSFYELIYMKQKIISQSHSFDWQIDFIINIEVSVSVYSPLSTSYSRFSFFSSWLTIDGHVFECLFEANVIWN